MQIMVGMQCEAICAADAGSFLGSEGEEAKRQGEEYRSTNAKNARPAWFGR